MYMVFLMSPTRKICLHWETLVNSAHFLSILLYRSCVCCTGPDIIVCDEGHVMRNASSNLFTVLQRVRTRTRIVLTGTPLQNNLVECESDDLCQVSYSEGDNGFIPLIKEPN